MGLPAILEPVRCLPRELLVPHPEPDHMPPTTLTVTEGFPRVQQAEVVEELHVPLLELQRDRVLQSGEVHRIQRLGLRVRERGQVLEAGSALRARQRSARETGGYPLGLPVVEQDRSSIVRRRGGVACVGEITRSVCPFTVVHGITYLSNGQVGSEKTWMRSGRSAAISL